MNTLKSVIFAVLIASPLLYAKNSFVGALASLSVAPAFCVNQTLIEYIQKKISVTTSFLKHAASLNQTLKKQTSIHLTRKTFFPTMMKNIAKFYLDTTLSPLSTTSKIVDIIVPIEDNSLGSLRLSINSNYDKI